MAIRITIKPGSFEALDQAKASVRQVVFASVLDLANDLRDTTPVDTGFAANSWFEQANGSPPAGVGWEGPDGARGTREAVTSVPDPGAIMAGIGGVISLVNTAAYIEKLNEGSSPQAPAGFVEAAGNRLQDHIDAHVMAANAS